MTQQQHPAPPDVRLEIGGMLYGGWTSIEIKRGLEQMAGTFNLEVASRRPGQEASWPIVPGDPCRVLVDGTPVITGYVDDVDLDWTAKSHTYRVAGRDKTCDLVDCCPPSVQIKGATLPILARKWAAMFGIDDVVVQAECNKPAPNFKSDEGDTCFEMLEKLARANAVMLTSDGHGRLVVTRSGTVKAAVGLHLGRNLLRLSGKSSMKERFSQITVKGQSGGKPNWSGKANAQAKGVASDPHVTRFRPLTIIAEQEEYASAATRARHEVNVRYGKSQSVTALVNGWRQGYAPGAPLWTHNILADVHNQSGALLYTWLIAEVVYRLDSGGWLAELTLNPREAFDRIPLKPKGKKNGDGKASWQGLKS